MENISETMKSTFEEFVTEVRAKMKELQGEQGIVEDLKQFAAAVDWSEPWLICLLLSEAILLVSVLLFRRRTYYQTAVFFSSAVVVKFAETINNYLAAHWVEFSTQPYFDQRGVFISAVVSAPLILTMFIVLVNYLIQSASLLVKMKRKELLYKARQRAREEGRTAGAEGKKEQ
mmetsp:Transcript_11861/g.28169  ORF Transcript_11861/g.28169 Transcript_11861/m.28169 type:complete len:174 (-) Transcript_11861:194-715(-)